MRDDIDDAQDGDLPVDSLTLYDYLTALALHRTNGLWKERW